MHIESPTSPRRGAGASLRRVAFTAIGLTLLVSAPAAQAAIKYVGGTGETVYGVAPYGVGPQPAPVFIANNITLFNDIMATPGGGFLLADPRVPNNIADTGLQPLALGSFKLGGGNAAGPFGAAATLITGPRIGFRMTDSAPGGGSASYMISSWEANFAVDGGGFVGNFGNFLSIGGFLSAPSSAAAVSLISNYYLNGAYVGQAAPLVLAAAGNGNFQALGGSGAVLQFGAGGRYRGLAINNIAANLVGGDNVRVVSTLTAFADPASIDTLPIQLDLLDLVGQPLPDFAFAGAMGGVPEPTSWALMILGFGVVGAAVRRRRPAPRPGVSPG